ncbi:MAG TPA: F0F1 ATP synthase subunit A [Candidatus Saccharimonadales bacterium]|nr:F0F1 ATP synthase subunit A [Candidatus Saccharimonadales bacterium]
MVGVPFFATAAPKVSIGAETLFHVGPIPFTNSMVLEAVGYLLVLVIMFGTVIMIKRKSRSRLHYGIVWVFETLLDTITEVTGSRTRAKKLAPLAMTLFFFILINNWLGFLPFLNGAVTYHGTAFFRGMASDMNTTFAMAIITMVTAQIWAIRKLGLLGNLKRYFPNPFTDPMHAFEGFLELVAEFSRGLALSLRLFGNVFGGEVLLAVIAYLSHWAAPLSLPLFMVFELMIDTIQAYIFFMLTVVYISIGVTDPDASHLTDERTHPTHKVSTRTLKAEAASR